MHFIYIVVRVINPVLALHNIPFSEKLHFPYVTKSDFFITNPCVESVFVPVLLVLHLAIESLILILAAEHSPLRSSSPLEAVFKTERISSLAQSVLDLPKPGTEAARTLPEPSFSNSYISYEKASPGTPLTILMGRFLVGGESTRVALTPLIHTYLRSVDWAGGREEYLSSLSTGRPTSLPYGSTPSGEVRCGKQLAGTAISRSPNTLFSISAW